METAKNVVDDFDAAIVKVADSLQNEYSILIAEHFSRLMLLHSLTCGETENRKLGEAIKGIVDAVFGAMDRSESLDPGDLMAEMMRRNQSQATPIGFSDYDPRDVREV